MSVHVRKGARGRARALAIAGRRDEAHAQLRRVQDRLGAAGLDQLAYITRPMERVRSLLHRDA